MCISDHEQLIDYLLRELKTAAISHVFRNTFGDLVVIAKHGYYVVAFHSLNIQDDNLMPIFFTAKINVDFQTNSGGTYLFYDDAV